MKEEEESIKLIIDVKGIRENKRGNEEEVNPNVQVIIKKAQTAV